MIRSKYEESMSPYDAAAGPGPDPGWPDATIDTLETRSWIGLGIEAAFAKTLRQRKAAQQVPATRAFNMGVLQT